MGLYAMAYYKFFVIEANQNCPAFHFHCLVFVQGLIEKHFQIFLKPFKKQTNQIHSQTFQMVQKYYNLQSSQKQEFSSFGNSASAQFLEAFFANWVAQIVGCCYSQSDQSQDQILDCSMCSQYSQFGLPCNNFAKGEVVEDCHSLLFWHHQKVQHMLNQFEQTFSQHFRHHLNFYPKLKQYVQGDAQLQAFYKLSLFLICLHFLEHQVYRNNFHSSYQINILLYILIILYTLYLTQFIQFMGGLLQFKQNQFIYIYTHQRYKQIYILEIQQYFTIILINNQAQYNILYYNSNNIQMSQLRRQDSLTPQLNQPQIMAEPQQKQIPSPSLLNQKPILKMESLEIQKLSQSNNSNKNICQLTVVVTLISLSSFYFGFSLTYLQTIPDATLVQFYGQIIQHHSTLPILIGAMPVGAIFGSLLAQQVMNCFTRKNFLIFVNIMAFITNLIIQITNIWVLLTCRIFIGIFVGLYMGIVPIYIHQICPKKVNGFFGAFTQMQHLLGNCISYFFGMIFYLAHFQGQFMMRFQFLFTSLLIAIQMIFILFGYIPQSPNSLLRNGKIQQAKNVLSLFNDQSIIQQLLHQKMIQNKSAHIKLVQFQIQQQEQQQQSNRSKLPLNGQQKQKQKQEIVMTYKTYILGFQLPFSQQLTGVNFLVTQLTSITSIYNAQLSHYTALIANVVQLIATSLSTQLLDRLGRRPLILAGNLSIGILNVVLGVVFMALHYWKWEDGFPIGMALILVFNIIFGLTLGPVVWLYIPEIVTQKIVPLATATYWCGCSICVIVAPIVTNSMDTPFAVFIFLGLYLLVVFGPNYFLVVETKGLTAEQINQKFKIK